MNQDTWDKIVSESKSLLSSGVGHEWTERHARSIVCGLLPRNSKEISTLLWDSASKLCHFIDSDDDSLILASYGRGADQFVEAVKQLGLYWLVLNQPPKKCCE